MYWEEFILGPYANLNNTQWHNAPKLSCAMRHNAAGSLEFAEYIPTSIEESTARNLEIFMPQESEPQKIAADDAASLVQESRIDERRVLTASSNDNSQPDKNKKRCMHHPGSPPEQKKCITSAVSQE